MWDRGSFGARSGGDSLGAGRVGPHPDPILLQPAGEHGRLRGQSGVAPEQDIRHLSGDEDRPSPGCDVNLQVGVRSRPGKYTQGQTDD